MEAHPDPALVAALADRYRIERQLGQGGMATVYLAEDLKHHRRVAIKVLRPELAVIIGAQRFLREITTVAALQHPHILGLIDSGEVSGTAWYVMPYVDGESLRTRLQREKQLPIPDALRIAAEVSGALDYAHRQGIIHRDIKPENIMLLEESALIVDFGIALAMSAAGGTRMTETGMSLGTPHYMSPEQAMGQREITARSDVYALGATVYEMLVGDPPFTGSTPQAIVAKVLTEQPVPPASLRHTVPDHVEDAVLTALQKLPADRFPSAAAFASALAGTTPTLSGGHSTRVRSRQPPLRRARLAWAVPALLAVGAAFWLGHVTTRHSAAPVFGRGMRLSWQAGLEIQPAVSPDGRFMAYAGGTATATRIFVRQVAGGRAVPLTEDSTVVQSAPTWSPDGTRVLYLADSTVFSAPASGGPARQEVRARPGAPIRSAEWDRSAGTIAFAAGDSLFLQAVGDTARFLAPVRNANDCRWSPDSRAIACASGNASFASIGPLFGNLAPSAIVVVSVPDGRRRYLTDSAAVNQVPAWSPDGRWVYFVSNRDGPLDIYRVSADGGQPTRLTTGLSVYAISLSADGSALTYQLLQDVGNIWSLRLGAGPLSQSQAEPVTRGTLPVDAFSVSHDGKWVLFSADLAGNGDLYRMPATGGETERLTVDPAGDFAPDLSPGPRPEVVFHSWRSGTRDIYVLPLDGGRLQTVAASPREEVMPRWSPDGSAVVASYFDDVGGIAITRRSADGNWEPPVDRTGTGEYPSWSPDGRFLVYTTFRDGGSLMVIPVDSGPPRVVLDASREDTLRAGMPFFSADGREILFMSRDASGVASIWRIAAGGGVPRRVVAFDDPTHPVYHPFWALTDTRIFFTAQEQRSEIWVVRLTP